jgi:DNA-binding MarR family transcriptional regulator
VGERGQVEDTGNPGIVLSGLTSIERDSTITQRALARELGIALGLANAYLRRCVRKGLVKMRQVPINRYAYYLTPQGLAEKSRLTAEYLAVSLDFISPRTHQLCNVISSMRGARLADCRSLRRWRPRRDRCAERRRDSRRSALYH